MHTTSRKSNLYQTSRKEQIPQEKHLDTDLHIWERGQWVSGKASTTPPDFSRTEVSGHTENKTEMMPCITGEIFFKIQIGNKMFCAFVPGQLPQKPHVRQVLSSM